MASLFHLHGFWSVHLFFSQHLFLLLVGVYCNVPWECKCCSFFMNVVPIFICYPQEFHLCNMQEMLHPLQFMFC
jgi:hypothetical protein